MAKPINFVMVNNVKVLSAPYHCFFRNPKRYKDNRRITKDNKSDHIEMRASPIDVRSTTSGYLYLIHKSNICLIKHHEHMERGNRLRTNVMGCLTPSPHRIKYSNPSLVEDSVFSMS